MQLNIHLLRSLVLALLSLTAALAVAGQQGSSKGSSNLILFGRGIYPGDDTSFNLIRNAGFNTVVLSSFYIRSNGDVYSGDDTKNPIIQDGRYKGDKGWLKRVKSLRQMPAAVKRIEVLLEGRWFNQAPNTYDFIRDWIDSSKGETGVITGTGEGSTLYGIVRVLKDVIGADAVCIDDESVYDSISIIRLGQMLNQIGMKMTLCPYTRVPFWKAVADSTPRGLVDAVYLQCYDGGGRNTPTRWVRDFGSGLPVYPIFLCRGAFNACNTTHNSKTPEEIRTAMEQYREEYPALSGGGIWQMADIKAYVRRNCALLDPSSGTAASVAQYLRQLRMSLE